MKERIFYGKVKTENGGVGQLEENYLEGPVKWFGEMKEGDIAIISEDNRIKNIRKVKSVKTDNDFLIYTFEKVLENDFSPEKTPSDILCTKYFKFDKVSANLSYKQNTQNFNELTLNEEYLETPIEKIEFNENAYKTIYISKSLDAIKKDNINIKPRDFFIIVSDRHDGYMIKEVFNLSGDGTIENFNLKNVNDTLNIEEYGLEKAYILNEKNQWTKKAKELKDIIESIDKNGYYIHPHESGLAQLYDLLIVKDFMNPKKDNSDGGESDDADMDGDNRKIKNLDEKLQLTDKECNLNQIFYGAPGCGKSYKVKQILEKNNIDNKHSERILFYPDYSYTDFVGQIVPKVTKKDAENKNEITYEFKPGPFSKILKKALVNESDIYVLVIDELNRGNAPAIFGDVFQLLDRDKVGNSQYLIKNDMITQYLKEKDEIGTIDIEDIFIPHNLYIFATMNTSDQNVFTLDTAFKRRWYFEKISNTFEDWEEQRNILISGIKDTDGNNITWGDFQARTNAIITKELFAYGIDGEDKQLGKYFVTEDDLMDKNKFAHKVLMYLWEDVVKVNRDILFDTQKYTTLDAVIAAFTDEKIGMKVFKGKNTEGEDLSEQ